MNGRKSTRRWSPIERTAILSLTAENENTFYVAYVSEQNLIEDPSGEPVEHPDVRDLFGPF